MIALGGFVIAREGLIFLKGCRQDQEEGKESKSPFRRNQLMSPWKRPRGSSLIFRSIHWAPESSKREYELNSWLSLFVQSVCVYVCACVYDDFKNIKLGAKAPLV